MDSKCDLSKKKCQPCERGGSPLSGEALKKFQQQIANDWKVVNNHHLEKEYKFSNFREALDFTNQVGEIAEEEGHHPDILLSWGKVVIQLWTHEINGLSENDFIVASKCDALSR